MEIKPNKGPRPSGRSAKKTNGDSRQQIPDAESCTAATLALPCLSEANPPPMHPTLPAAMMQKDHKGIFNPVVP